MTTYIALERGIWQDICADALFTAGLDEYGLICDERLRRFVDSSDLSDDVQRIRIGDYEILPYYWGDDDLHPDVAEHPQFIDHKHHLSVWWYKYALRGASANREVDLDEWKAIWKDFTAYVTTRLAEIPAID